MFTFCSSVQWKKNLSQFRFHPTRLVFWSFRVNITNSDSWDGLESEFVMLVSLSRRPSVPSTRCSASARGSGAWPASTAHQSVLRGGPEVGFRDVQIDDFDREVGIFLAQISRSVTELGTLRIGMRAQLFRTRPRNGPGLRSMLEKN